MDVIYKACSEVFDTARSLRAFELQHGFSPLISEAKSWGFNRAPLSTDNTLYLEQSFHKGEVVLLLLFIETFQKKSIGSNIKTGVAVSVEQPCRLKPKHLVVQSVKTLSSEQS